MGELTGQTAIVTGASRGIGRAIAATLCAAGANVTISSRKQDALDATAAALTEAAPDGAGGVLAVAANAGDPDAARACVAATMDRFGRVDILVNNAATNPYMGELVGLDLPRAEKTHQVNLYGVVLWTGLAWKAWMSGNGGAVVNIASIGGIGVDPGIGYYNATKAAVIHLTRQLATELGPRVRVNAVAPGLIKTDMARALWEQGEHELAGRFPLRRLGTVEDVAEPVRFLVGPGASWITGHTIVVDGGALVTPIFN